MWAAQEDPRRAAEAWSRYAESLGETVTVADRRAQAYVAAAEAFSSVGALERAAEARRHYARVLGLPYIVLEVHHDGLLLDAWSRLRLVIHNAGFGRARDVIIRAEGEQFEEQITETQMLAALPAGQREEAQLDVEPLEHGESVPLRVQIAYLDQNGEPHRREETLYLAVARKAAKRVPGSFRLPGDAATGAWAGDPLALPPVDLEIRISQGSRDYGVELTVNGTQVYSGGRVPKSILEWVPSGDSVQDGIYLFDALFRMGHCVRVGTWPGGLPSHKALCGVYDCGSTPTCPSCTGCPGSSCTMTRSVSQRAALRRSHGTCRLRSREVVRSSSAPSAFWAPWPIRTIWLSGMTCRRSMSG